MFSILNFSVPQKYRSILVLSGSLVLFILGLLPNTMVFVIIKILYFTAFIGLLYMQFQNSDLYQEEKGTEEELPQIPEKSHEWLKIEYDQDIEKLFENFLDNVLNLIKTVLVADSIILLFANYSKKIFTIRRKVTDRPDDIIQQNSFDIMKGLPSLVLRNRTALIENSLPTEGREIIPYYKENENPPKSFAGVPVAFKDYIIGVLAVDSTVEEAYSNEDLEILKNFSQLITYQLFNSNKLYEYETENWVANVLFDVSKGMNGIQHVDELWDYFTKKIPEIIECNRLSISIKINEKEGQIVRIEGGIGNLIPGKIFPLNEGIVGWVIRKNQSLKVEDFSTKENYVPRFCSEETPAIDYFSLLAVPISRGNELIGAICLESYSPHHFKDHHRQILSTISNQAATVYSNAKTFEQFNQLIFKDISTQIENINAFKFIYPKEFKKSIKFGWSYSLIFIRTNFELREQSQQYFSTTINEFLSLVLPHISDSDYIFRLFEDTFVILKVVSDLTQIRSFVNLLIKTISEKKVWSGGQSFDFSLNIGVIPANYLNSEVETMLEMGKNILNQAAQNGPNSIVFYKGEG